MIVHETKTLTIDGEIVLEYLLGESLVVASRSIGCAHLSHLWQLLAISSGGNELLI